MNEPTETARSAKAEALLLHFTAEVHRRKWEYDRGLNDDGVPIKSEAFDAMHRLGEEMRVKLEELRASPAAPAGPAPATDRNMLREPIAEALAREDAHNAGYDHGFVGQYGVDPETDGFVDAVLAVLPAPDQQTAVLLSAAAHVQSGRIPYNAEAAEAALKNGGPFALIAYVQLAVAEELRGLAGETQQDEAERRVYAWAQTIDTTDAGQTVHIPGVHHSGAGVEETAIVVRREDVPTLRAMLTECAAQQNEAPHPPHDSWLVQVWLPDGDGWHVAYPTEDKAKALDRLERGRRESSDREWRLVRMTTSYALEDQPAREARQDPAPDGEERVKHSGPDTEFCVLCLSGEHERTDTAQPAGGQQPAAVPCPPGCIACATNESHDPAPAQSGQPDTNQETHRG